MAKQMLIYRLAQSLSLQTMKQELPSTFQTHLHLFNIPYQAISRNRSFLTRSAPKTRSERDSQSWVSVHLEDKSKKLEGQMNKCRSLIDLLANVYANALKLQRPEHEIELLLSMVRQRQSEYDKAKKQHQEYTKQLSKYRLIKLHQKSHDA